GRTRTTDRAGARHRRRARGAPGTEDNPTAPEPSHPLRSTVSFLWSVTGRRRGNNRPVLPERHPPQHDGEAHEDPDDQPPRFPRRRGVLVGEVVPTMGARRGVL